MTPSPRSVAVVGGGIAGLAAARALQHAGVRATVFDKGRSAGGRAATRRREPHQFDHGAQFFTVRTPGFAAALRPASANTRALSARAAGARRAP
ncbi:MAG: FAD-dependent oxidoreductase [Planctomycetota bacterium]